MGGTETGWPIATGEVAISFTTTWVATGYGCSAKFRTSKEMQMEGSEVDAEWLRDCETLPSVHSGWGKKNRTYSFRSWLICNFWTKASYVLNIVLVDHSPGLKSRLRFDT